MPVIPTGIGDGQFIATDVEGRSLPAVRGLHLKEPVTAIRFVTGDVVTVAIAIFDRGPAHFGGQVIAVCLA